MCASSPNHETDNKTNSNVSRTLDAIYLRPTQNQQGGHDLTMDLTTVVWLYHETSSMRFKSLKFKNRHGVIFHDADWIAGVDYDDNDDDEEDDDEEYHHNNEDDDKNKEELEKNKRTD
jgi:hypothetical protein